jgi:glycosyltransferase involved in cell wall biosynthesis
LAEVSVVQVVAHYPPHLGGMQKVASTLAEELAKVGPVEVLTTNIGAKKVPRVERDGRLTIRRLLALEVANLPVAPGMFFRCLRIKPRSIVHVHVAQALVPEIVWISRWLRRGKFIAHFHLDVAPSGRFGRIFVWYKKNILGHTLRAAAKVIALSADQARFLELTYKVSPDNIAVISNGISSDFSAKPKTDRLAHRPLRVLYVGRLTKQKALPRLIHALAAMTQPAEALLIGEGDERLIIEDLVRGYGLDNVRLPGRRQGEELVATYQWADVFVLPSDREGMPLAALEAMACGLPIVATDVVGNRELISDVGILVSPEAEALSSALDQVAGDEVLRSELGKKSLGAAENYTIDRMVKRVSELYAEVAKSLVTVIFVPGALR